MKINFEEVADIEVDGIDTADYPDFCDAFISSFTYKGRDATDEEVEAINEDGDFVYDCVQEELY